MDFEELDADILNPERGHYTSVDLVDPASAVTLRERGVTTAIALVRLDDYRDSPLDDALLDSLDDGFAAVRETGVKVILRFTYNASFDADAPKERILEHIAQLEPTLRKNSDVIAVMQAGFIGAWGEWHGSEYDLDNDADRGDVLDAILAALPAHRSVQLRTPMYKKAALGAPLDTIDLWDGSKRSRVGHHNDCFLASESDLGTYASPVQEWRDYVATDSQFVPVGGETCLLNAPRTDCAAALEELAALHFSYLNRDYRQEVLDGWIDQGCDGEIRQRLGYRLVASRLTHDETAHPGARMRMSLEMENRGFAAPFNPRDVYVTLTGADRRVAMRLDSIDPRRWLGGGAIELSAEIEIPADLEPGTYQLGLWLPDADERLTGDSRYAIRLANAGTWDESTGDNVLSQVRVSP